MTDETRATPDAKRNLATTYTAKSRQNIKSIQPQIQSD